MKSITAPTVTRSIMFPMAPPKISAEGKAKERAVGMAKEEVDHPCASEKSNTDKETLLPTGLVT